MLPDKILKLKLFFSSKNKNAPFFNDLPKSKWSKNESAKYARLGMLDISVKVQS